MGGAIASSGPICGRYVRELQPIRRLGLRPGAPQLTSLRTTLPTGCAPLGSARAPRLTALRAGRRTGLHIWLGRPSRLGSGLLGLSLGYDQRGGGHRDAQRGHQSKKGKRLSPRDRFRLYLFTHVRPLKPLNRFMNRNNLQCERRAVSDLDQRAAWAGQGRTARARSPGPGLLVAYPNWAGLRPDRNCGGCHEPRPGGPQAEKAACAH